MLNGELAEEVNEKLFKEFYPNDDVGHWDHFGQSF